MKKKTVSLLLVLTMLLTILPVAVFAADVPENDVVLQTYNSGTSEITLSKNADGSTVTLTPTGTGVVNLIIYETAKEFTITTYDDIRNADGDTSDAGGVYADDDTTYPDRLVKGRDFDYNSANGASTSVSFPNTSTAVSWTIWVQHMGASGNKPTMEVTIKDGKIQVPQCAITWNLDGGTGDTTNFASQDQGADLKAPTVTKPNYTFAGWVDTGNGDAAVDLATAKVPTASTASYKATWTPKTEPTAPTTSAITYKYGLKLSDITLSGGWAWTNGNQDLTVADSGKTYEAKVAETTTHQSKTDNIAVTINKGAVTVTGAAQGRIGKTLDSIDLTGKVTVKDANNNAYTLTPESIEWKTPTDVIAANKNDHTVVVTLKAADAALYDLDPNGEYDVEVEGVDKEPTTFSGVKDLTGKVDETLTPTVTASSGKTVTYTSSDETKVKVENGKLVLVAVGEATITASVEGDADWAANTTTFKVTVVEAADPHAAFMFGYANTKNFGPDDSLNRAQAVTILARLDGWTDGEETPLTGAMFSDVKEKDAAGNDIWYYDAVCYAKENGIVEGFADGTFGADKPITRAEFTKMLSRLSNGGVDPADADSTLADAKAHWANKWIADVETTYPGSITGRQDGKFHPDDKITRAETAKIINACLGRLQLVSPKEEDQMDADLNAFDDVIRCTWYYNNVIEATVDHDASDADFHTVD